jgi:peroxiredoxin
MNVHFHLNIIRRSEMKRTIVFLICILFSLTMSQPSAAQHGPYKPGDLLPKFELKTPEIPEQKEYLGLKPDMSSFTLEDIQAEAVLVQIFSMYCPICQKEAPAVNELYAHIQSKGLDDKIKILGIGAGNSDLEVQVFRDRYTIPFPLISDPDYVLHKIFGEAGTPYFLLLQPAGEQYRVKLSHLGGFDDPDSFLNQILEAITKE